MLLLNKLPFPDMGTSLVPYLRLQQAVSGPSVMMWLQLRLPEFKQREEHCRHDGCLTNARCLQSQKHICFKSNHNLHLQRGSTTAPVTPSDIKPLVLKRSRTSHVQRQCRGNTTMMCMRINVKLTIPLKRPAGPCCCTAAFSTCRTGWLLPH